MAKEKDPAFLFYPKDWLQGTSQMMPEEKGVYIDLLAHQHQDGDLPSETKRLARMVGMSESEFLPIWKELKKKFISTEGHRLVNQKLTKVVSERVSRSKTNTIAGIFASALRYNKLNLTDEQKSDAKRNFRTSDFMMMPDDSVKSSVDLWLSSRYPPGSKSIGNGDANANGDNKEGGSGEEKFIVPQMCQLWYKEFPSYTADKDHDYEGMGKILKFISNQAGLKDPSDSLTQSKILSDVQMIASEVKKDGFWVNKPVKSIANNIQQFYNQRKNPVNGRSQKTGTGRGNKTAGVERAINSALQDTDDE